MVTEYGELAERAKITRHARERMEQMGVTEDEVRSAIRYPISTEPDYRSRYRRLDNTESQVTYHHGRRVTPVVAEDGNVLTVLWTDGEAGRILTPERWTRRNYDEHE